MMCAILGCTAQVHLFAAVLCGSPAIVFPFRCLLLVGFCYGLCVLSILCICGDLCVQSVMLCACTCLGGYVRSTSLVSSLAVRAPVTEPPKMTLCARISVTLPHTINTEGTR